jgi:hypothetical protein
MKQLKLIMLFCIGAVFIASKSNGQANPFINVLPSNSGIVEVGSTIDIVVTIGNTGPVSTIAQAKLRPIIQIPTSVTFLSNAQQSGLPAGWTIISNTGSQLRLCNSTDPIAKNTSRTITLKAQGVSAAPAQTFSGNINFGNGTTCAAGTSVAGDLTTDNSALSTIRVVAPVTLNLNAFLQGYYSGANTMATALANQGVGSSTTNVDSVTVELHGAASPYALAYSVKGVLQTNGSLSCTFPYEATGNGYYIVIKHRNSVETWSADTVTMSSSTSYNFTTAANKAYGDNQVELEPNVFGIYSGDMNQDGFVDVSDYPAFDYDASIGVYAEYVATDLNGDGFVDVSDYPLFDLNSSVGVYAILP